MSSPFPGMDPWLESHWRDVHSSLVIYARDALQRRLPPPLRARVEERVFVESPEEQRRSSFPDVRVVEHPRAPRAGAASPSGAAAVAEPLLVHVKDEPVTQRYLEIVDTSGGRVVCVIEMVSPTNKAPGEGQDLYLQKQAELRQGGVSSVEIDLTRAGERVLTIPAWQIPSSHRSTYQVVARRGHRPAVVEVYRVPLGERLPVIRVPLRETDQDVPLDLQELIERCWENGGYEGTLDYSGPPDPPLSPEDAAWAHERLVAAGLRPH